MIFLLHRCLNYQYREIRCQVDNIHKYLNLNVFFFSVLMTYFCGAVKTSCHAVSCTFTEVDRVNNSDILASPYQIHWQKTSGDVPFGCLSTCTSCLSPYTNVLVFLREKLKMIIYMQLINQVMIYKWWPTYGKLGNFRCKSAGVIILWCGYAVISKIGDTLDWSHLIQTV
jgi:hypothetical protein